ncbi:MAG: hypothetical protein NT165_01910 [Candidatus Falkowbacteria bacterium]|nr:hypothetical protein [Candidatus Falkowbacteria bacterium]
METKWITILLIACFLLRIIIKWRKNILVDDFLSNIETKEDLALADTVPKRDLGLYLKKIRKYLEEGEIFILFAQTLLARLLASAGLGEVKLSLDEEDFLQFKMIFNKFQGGDFKMSGLQAKNLLLDGNLSLTEDGKAFLGIIQMISSIKTGPACVGALV